MPNRDQGLVPRFQNQPKISFGQPKSMNGGAGAKPLPPRRFTQHGSDLNPEPFN